MALVCPDEAALQQLRARLSANGVRHCAIVENDGPYAGQLCAIGCMPAPKEVLRKFLSSLPLLR